MTAVYKIHPSIGIARAGNSPTEFYLAPEARGALPIQCDPVGNPVVGPDGKEAPVTHFKDAQGRIKRQAARFRVLVYDDKNPGGSELQVGDSIEVLNLEPGHITGQVLTGTLQDIEWTVYLANKKASWYQFKELNGEHGYASGDLLRNSEITDADARQNLIIDPGPQTVSYGNKNDRVAEFAKGKNPGMPQSFPPSLSPNSIDTLGEIRATQQDKYNRLVVLGGFGNSGSADSGLGQPVIRHFANNDGWFDDLSDGPVTASLKMNVTKVDGHDVPARTASISVGSAAWVIIGYPRYAPQIVDIVTLDDIVYDIALRYFAFNNFLYGVPPFQCGQPVPKGPDSAAWRSLAQYNPDYRPYFWRDIWPILTRPNNYQWVMDFDPFTGGEPHNTAPGTGQAFDPDRISIPPFKGEDPLQQQRRSVMRKSIYLMLRQPGGENRLTKGNDKRDPNFRPFAMPFLCGDNPLSNSVPSKFLVLTETMLFFLKQWADGKFINEKIEELPPQPPQLGLELDRGSLGNMLGGAFCPGAEVCWILRNPAIYAEAYRLHHSKKITPGGLSQPAVVAGAATSADVATGLEPGDITKYDALPWQADFNECSTQDIDVTYEQWNNIQPGSTGDPVVPGVQTTYWWPAHRPMRVFQWPTFGSTTWSPTPQNHSGDLQMVTAWSSLGFVLKTNAAVDSGLPDFADVPSGDSTVFGTNKKGS
jgi:hypothetical protein